MLGLQKGRLPGPKIAAAPRYTTPPCQTLSAGPEHRCQVTARGYQSLTYV